MLINKYITILYSIKISEITNICDLINPQISIINDLKFANIFSSSTSFLIIILHNWFEKPLAGASKHISNNNENNSKSGTIIKNVKASAFPGWISYYYMT